MYEENFKLSSVYTLFRSRLLNFTFNFKIDMNFVRSSVDPEKIALTVRGLAVLVPTVIVILSKFHVDVGPDELTKLINLIADFILVAAAAVATATTILGLIRKLYVSFFTPIKQEPPQE